MTNHSPCARIARRSPLGKPPEKLDQFIAEHEAEVGEAEAFALTVQAMTGTSKEAPEAPLIVRK